MKLGSHLGVDAELQGEATPVVRLRLGKRVCLAGFGARLAGQNVSSPRAIDEATVERIAQALELTRIARRGDRALILAMPLRLDGGVTVEWLANALRYWFAARRTCERLLKRSTPPLALVQKSRRPSDARGH